MKIVINSGGQSFGPYSTDEVRGLLDTGKFNGNDFAWSDKTKYWSTINDALDADSASSSSTSEHLPLSLPLLDLPAKSPRLNIQFPDKGVVINSAGQNYGPYKLPELRELLSSGKFQQNDLAWSEQDKDWVTIAELLVPPQAVAPTPQPIGNSRYPSMAATPAPAVQPKNIMINSGGQNYGPYSPDQVREFVRWGIFQMNDFAWSETTNAWLSVVELLRGTALPQPQLQPGMSIIPMAPQFQVQMQPQYPAQYAMSQPPRPKKATRTVAPSKAKVIVISGGQKFGPYSPGHAHEFLRSGKFHENDFAWSDAHNGWLTLGEVLDELRPYARKGAKPPAAPSLSGPVLAPMAPMAPMISMQTPMMGYTPFPMMAPMQMAPAMGYSRNPVEEAMNKPYIERNPVAPKRRTSAASVMAATSKNFGPSF